MCDIVTRHLAFVGSILSIDDVQLYFSDTLGALVVRLYTLGGGGSSHFLSQTRFSNAIGYKWFGFYWDIRS